MLCPSCFINEAIPHSTLGPLPCKECAIRQSRLASPNQSIEIIPERIKAEREERADSILQPHLKHELDKKWVDINGEQAAKDRGFSDKEIKNARYVSDDIRTKNTALSYYKNST